MAKKSLKKRIDDLVNELGGSQPPSNADVRGKLVELGLSVEALEEGAAIRDAEAKAAVLETENSNLKVELSELQTEVKAFRAERKQQEEEERQKDIPDIQLQILTELPSYHGGSWRRMDEIRRAVGGILADEASIHLDRLEKAKLVERGFDELFQATVWH